MPNGNESVLVGRAGEQLTQSQLTPVQPALAQPLIVFYNSIFGDWPEPSCSDCQLSGRYSNDRALLDGADAIVFHLPTLFGVPSVKRGPLRVAWSQVSDVTVPALRDACFRSQFHLSMTYRRDSSVWMPDFGPVTAAALLAPPLPKTAGQPVCHFQSSRNDGIGRIAFVAELMQRTEVASYGTVLPTVPQAGSIAGREGRLAVMARHKFTLAFENSVSADYVTNKFFDPLVAGSVPVYRGAPNVAEFAPGPRSYIDAADFSGPADLADYLNHLDQHPAEYEEYLTWKHDGPSPAFRALLAQADHPYCRLAQAVSQGVSQALLAGDRR